MRLGAPATAAALLIAGCAPLSLAFQLHSSRHVSPQPSVGLHVCSSGDSTSSRAWNRASRWHQPRPPHPANKRGIALFASVVPEYAADLSPGIDAINSQNADLYGQLNTLRTRPFFRLYSVDILASCEYLPQELFECYSESCEIYPVDDDEVSRGVPVRIPLMLVFWLECAHPCYVSPSHTRDRNRRSPAK